MNSASAPEPRSTRIAASVIVPSFRGEQRLPELLERLTVQDFEGTWEVVVALDGEFDGSRAVLAGFEDRLPLRVIASAENRGVVPTLNDAYAAAAGDVLIRCDDDLSPKPDMVRRHVDWHTANAAALGVIGATRDVFPDTPYARAYGAPANRRSLEAVYRRSADMRWMHWAAHNSVTRETWERVGGFDPRFTYGEDSEFGFRLFRDGVHIVVDPALEIEHRGPASSAAVRLPRAFVSWVSRREFESAHPGAHHENARGTSVPARLWDAAVGATSAVLRSPAAFARVGRAIDRLPASIPPALRGRLIALGVEAAGRAGYAAARSHPSTSGYDWESTRLLTMRDRSAAKRGRVVRDLPLALWIVPVADLGGVARHVLDATRVGVPGWRIVVFCPEGPLARELRAQGTPVVTASFGPAAGFCASRESLRRLARALRPDIVHSHLAYADIVSACTPMPRRTMRFTTEHGIAGEDAVYHRSNVQARVMALAHRLRFARFDGVIAVSRATRDAMVAKWHVDQPILVIPNGVDGPARVVNRTEHGDARRILSLSRLAPEKRIDKLIEAFALVKKARPEATLTIAGDGPLRDDLVALANRLGVADAVTLPGYLDAKQAMESADVLVQLSVWENCSYTLLDARARGLRIVASDAGGNREIVEHGSLLRSVDAASVAAAILSDVHPTSSAVFSTAEMTAATAKAYRSDRIPEARS